MASSLIFIVSAIIASVTPLIGVYAALWAFRIRHALFVRIYRNQALGIGMIAVFIAVTYLLLGDLGAVLPSIRVLLLPLIWFGSLVLLYWIDSSVMAGRRSDPLLRDTARWKYLRFLILGLNVFGILSILTINILVTVFGAFNVNSIPGGLLLFLIFLPIFATCVAGAVVLPVGARRSKDPTLRKHFGWFGRFVGIFIVGVSSAILLDQVFGIDGGIVLFPLGIVEGYCLYRSVKSLAPLNKLSLVELISPLSKDTSLEPITSIGHLVKASNVKY